ncbi:exodeoxyribonuclease V subunit alpha [Gordonia sp. PKS22-38]|uniref:RecBCD enzyme subunit RecD n=1 Tax=Gordonia prachuapensis TaxID=3115651 RepID=A0ABU7MW81_9ACTN|nr:exodeoxyribonuclease V subunit alpha [Gordonia sp. PKS22-38]
MTTPEHPGVAAAGSVRPLHDARSTPSATGRLAELNRAGVLDAADLHVILRLTRLCGEPVDEIAQVGAALAVRAVRFGSTCLALARVAEIVGPTTDQDSDEAEAGADIVLPSPDELTEALTESVLVRGADTGPLRPLVLASSDDGPLLYLRKYFRQEQLIREVLSARERSRPDVDVMSLNAALADVFGPAESGGVDRQRLAAQMAAVSWNLVVAGGPGTGKTYTVARILAVLDRLSGGSARIGLCAPTGRAAAQLQAAVSADEAAPSSVRAVTVHSLLGWRPGSAPRHGRGNKLPYDVVVVDETSMLSMTAMSKLLDAVRPDTRVILVGDPHQLASVEAGAVLADLVDREIGTQPARLPDGVVAGDMLAGLADRDRIERGVVTLQRGHRFGGGIAEVASAINRGDPDAVLDLVTGGELTDIELVSPDDLDGVRADVVAWGAEMTSAAEDGDAVRALDALDSHRVLCAHRDGSWGVQGWSRRVVDWLADSPGAPTDPMSTHPGEPLLVTANDRQTETFNGDSGVVIRSSGGVEVALRRGSRIRRLHPTRLADVVPLYAMTIHRSQGSQFDAVTVVLPPAGSELLTRELLYTAVTRARRTVRIVGTPDVLAAAVRRRVQRASGLRSPISVVDTGRA